MEGNSGGGGGGGGGGNDAELLSKTLQVEHKLFYFDLKENPRGRYLKISEKTSLARSTIILPFSGISWFLDLFNYYIGADEEATLSKELQIDNKSFYFDLGENRRGRFLKVSEASVNRNRSTIIVPAGNALFEGWIAFRDVLAAVNEASALHPLPPNQSSVGHPYRVVGLSDDVGAGFISGQSDQLPPTSENMDGPIKTPPHDDSSSMDLSKVIRVDQKKFFFDLGTNNRGHFLKISEVAGSDRSSIILPLSGLKQFSEAVSHFVEITKDQTDAVPGPIVRTVDSSLR